MRDFGLSDRQLFPLLDDAAASLLRRLREHPHAPRYNWKTGERLDAAALRRVREFAGGLKNALPRTAGALPPWVMPFVRDCRRTVPFYRNRDHWNDEPFTALPLTSRRDIQREPWSFVPDGRAADDLIVYTTSGTSGTRLQIPATPELPARYLPLIEFMLWRVGVRLSGGNRVSIVQVCAQRGTVQLCSISSYLGGAGFVKVNLDPADWTDPADPVRFIDDCAPEILTGDPFAFWKLCELDLTTRPKAIVSSGTSLRQPLRETLRARFGCPVIDMYSMNETGPIAFATAAGKHEILPHDIHVEILDDSGTPAAAGTRGQVVITGGLNDCLPLVRYATGDTAALDATGLYLRDFQGRPPVLYRDTAGRAFSSIDVATALADVQLPRMSLVQHADGSLTLTTSAPSGEIERAVCALRRIFGAEQLIRVIENARVGHRKWIEHASEITWHPVHRA